MDFGQPVRTAIEIRESLDHPIVDCDGHWMEPIPLLTDYVRKVGGYEAAESFNIMLSFLRDRWYQLSREQRLGQRRMRTPWWIFPASTTDRATAMSPQLMHYRMDELGVDFSVIIGSLLPLWGRIPDHKLRATIVRASNIMHAELFSTLSNRLTPAAFVPLNEPEQAMEELSYAVTELGLRTAVVNGGVWRFSASSVDDVSATNSPAYVDALALDSDYEYDPVWAMFTDLKVGVLSHASSMGLPDRRSPTNFTYNHLGHFAQASHSFAKALVLGGVSERYPDLPFGFLEGGVCWARNLCSDLEGHWAKRNVDALESNLRPTNLDEAELLELLRRHSPWLSERDDPSLLANLDSQSPGLTIRELSDRETEIDDFRETAVSSGRELADRFASRFFFGCEADDPLTCLAFDSRLGPRLRAVLGSDFSHFDVVDMSSVIPDAYHLVERELLTAEDFRDFVFANAVDLLAGLNVDFFNGTDVATAAKKEITAEPMGS